MDFRDLKVLYLIKILLKFILKGPIDDYNINFNIRCEIVTLDHWRQIHLSIATLTHIRAINLLQFSIVYSYIRRPTDDMEFLFPPGYGGLIFVPSVHVNVSSTAGYFMLLCWNHVQNIAIHAISTTKISTRREWNTDTGRISSSRAPMAEW